MTVLDTAPAGCTHSICLDLQGDACHLGGATTAGQVLNRLDRRALLAHMTRESLGLGLYGIPADDYPAKETR